MKYCKKCGRSIPQVEGGEEWDYCSSCYISFKETLTFIDYGIIKIEEELSDIKYRLNELRKPDEEVDS